MFWWILFKVWAVVNLLGIAGATAVGIYKEFTDNDDDED